MSYTHGNTYKLSFADLPSHLTNPEKSLVKIFPVPYEATTTYKGGTKEAPDAIIQASKNLELWDEELSIEPCEVGISTFPPFQCSSAGPKIAIKQIYEYTKKILENYPDRFYIFIGGEHSITSGILKAFHSKFSSLSLLQLDAHADLRDTYQGSPYNHACVMRRIAEFVSFVQLGIRSLSKEEKDFIQKNDIPYQTSAQILQSDKWKKIIDTKLSEKVYITVDVDVLDPSIMPSVGTPEPGGLGWAKILEIIRYVAQRKKVMGIDIVEFSPIPGIIAPDFLVAKLIYKIIGYLVFYQKIP